MRAALALLLSLLLAAASRLPEPPVRAEDVIGAGSAGAPRLRDGLHWLEDCGIGIGLTPAPPGSPGLPRLLAGDPDNGIELHEYAPGAPPDWAGLFASAPRPAQPITLGADRVEAVETVLESDGAVVARVIEWQLQDRGFALVARGKSTVARDALLRQIALVPVPAGGRAMLLGHGSHACVLRGWLPAGLRSFRVANGTRMGMRAFTLPRRQYADVEAMQRDLESRLAREGFRRSGGERPPVPGGASFLAEYFGADGFVQRVLYAEFDGALQVLLFQAPQAARDELARESKAVAASIRAVGLAVRPQSDPFSNVQVLRAVAWREGNGVAWGALFDDARGAEVIWRESGVSWTAELRAESGIVARQDGVAASSLDLNPLRGPDTRTLKVPEGTSGDVELLIRVGSLRTTARVHDH